MYRKNQWAKEILKNSPERKYWSDLLGKSTLEYVLASLDDCYKNNDDAILSEMIQEYKAKEHNYYEAWLREECFYSFYEPLMGFAGEYFLKHHETVWLSYNSQIQTMLLMLLFKKTESLALRVLINDMKALKNQQQLTGNNSKEEYEFYVSHYLADREHHQKLLDKYPVILRLYLNMTLQLGRYLEEFTQHFLDDKADIETTLLDGNRIEKILDLEMNFSDAHFGGRTVIKVTFDNGRTLIYKPRTVKNDILYQKLYSRFANACGLDIYECKLLDRGSYGWSEFLHTDHCHRREEIGRYYRRLGIQLFICYLFSIKDMHYENIMAVGEYPVLVDLETFPGKSWQSEDGSIQSQALIKLANSTLTTGALPMAVWNFDGRGVRLGALGKGGRQKLPVKVPCAVNGKTSDMKIVMYHPEIEMKDNLPILNGSMVDPAEYTQELLSGFRMAYDYACAHREELLSGAEDIFNLNSRCLLRNTQQYSMYMSTSAYPAFLTDMYRQNLFFWELRNSDKVKGPWKNKIVRYETECLSYRDIPYFYTKGTTCSLFDSFGMEYENYYKTSALDDFKAKLSGLCSADRNFQTGIISLSLELIPDTARSYVNTYLEKNDENSRPWTQQDCLDTAVRLGGHLLDLMIYDDVTQEALWPALIYLGMDEVNWHLGVQNMYLYDGLAGTGLFMSELWNVTGEARFKNIFMCIRRQLFDYTTKQLSQTGLKANSGIFSGEASLIYVYLCWYKTYEDPVYLLFARKHSEVLEKVFREDTCFDLLSGNAGAMVAWVLLYELTKEQKYLDLAEEAAQLLRGHAQSMDVGKGWRIKGEEVPLAGISHGNSGFIAAFAHLYAVTHNPDDALLLGELLAYENSLYEPAIKNWKDLRKISHGKPAAGDDTYFDTVAWCHGAPGVLMARLAMKKMCPEIAAEIVDEDIQKALSKMMENKYRKGYCLCHGNTGNAMIAAMVLECGFASDKANELRKYCTDIITDLIRATQRMEFLPQELYNAGFMPGISGIGYGLLKLIRGEGNDNGRKHWLYDEKDQVTKRDE